MENKLLSMTEYIELQEKKIPYEESTTTREWDRLFVVRTIDYCRLLKRSLTLGMCVPADANGVLKEPYFDGENDLYYGVKKDAYNRAKDEVLFKGCVFDERGLLIFTKGYKFEVVGALEKGEIKIASHISTIEDLLKLNFDFELTEKQAKKYGL